MPEQIPAKIGHYRIVGVVGPSMSGWVYRGRDEIHNRDVWVKTLSPEAVDLPSARQWLQNEARATAHMTHPNIINVFELGESDGVVFIAFEALDGRSLLHAMNAGISLKVGLPVMLQVLAGLAHIHRMDIVHRNVHPGVIFICADGHAKITDLCLAKIIGPAAEQPDPAASVPSTIGYLGTTGYLSPEHVQGGAYDPRTDLFSVGCVLYEMVTGQKPFHADDLMAIFRRIIHDEPDMGLIPDGPEWNRLRGVITRALQKKPEDRYPDANAMGGDLNLALNELGGSGDWTPQPLRPAGPGVVVPSSRLTS